MARLVLAERAATVLDHLDRGGDMSFVENAAGTVVHVVAEATDEAGEPADPADIMLRLLLGDVLAVCGVTVYRNRGGLEEGGRYTASFPDDLLCQRCHAAFGDRAWLIFDHNPHGKDEGE